MIPGNLFSDLIDMQGGLDHVTRGERAHVLATLALAYEQHQANRLAAVASAHRAIPLPYDLAGLALEGDPS